MEVKDIKIMINDADKNANGFVNYKDFIEVFLGQQAELEYVPPPVPPLPVRLYRRMASCCKKKNIGPSPKDSGTHPKSLCCPAHK